MLELSDYGFLPLREGDFPLFRGSSNGLTPILVVTAKDNSLACLKRLEHEYALRATLDNAWAARPLALSRYHGQLSLVLEDPGGEPLDRQLARPLETSEFLRIALPLAGALRQVHEGGLIHKDIKPSNVLVNVAGGGVRLTGFGISVPVLLEGTSTAPEVITGTLAYMAPEQTGRMNRSIDARSDLYSMGITFYEMLTGTLPFSAADPIEWVHCHMARQPTPPEEVVPLPAAISAIVMKLLAKSPEDRYQSAAGVEVDLRKCLACWATGGRIDTFVLAAEDAPDRLLVRKTMYGREREIEALLGSFEHVAANGTTEFLLVSGYAGIGKSSLVQELHKVVVPPRGLFASGKFDQYQRDIPYATLAQAFKSIVRGLLGHEEADLHQWRDALHEAVGPNGQLIINLIPELELVIGRSPAVPDLPPLEAQNRFRRVFGRFLGVFARRERPLVLFLDDLQWVDAATLDLIEYLITQAQVRNLLLLGAYRDNEVGPAHPLVRALEAIGSSGAQVKQIVLAPLGVEDVGRLLADSVRCELERAQPLAQLVRQKTGGNPFFAIQLLGALQDEGLLTFDRDKRAWTWDMDRIGTRSYSDNVVDLMADKLKRLCAPTQEVLKQFACVGSIAAIDILCLIHGATEATTHELLRESVQAGLVLQLDNGYKFLHDRIQQAAYSLIPQERRAEVHVRLGRVLRSRSTASELAERLFDVANQFNRGAECLLDRDEKAQVATINLRAGRKAKASAAYASACPYLAAGMSLLEDRDWDSHYELMLGLCLERAECEFLSGRFATAEQLIGELLVRARSNIDLAAVYQVKLLLHTVKSENSRAVDSALECLRVFGIDFPAHPAWEQVQAEYEQVWQTLNGRPIESLIDLPLMTDPELQAAMQVMSVLGPPAYFTDFHLFCLLACRTVKISMQHGVSDASALGYAIFGFIIGPVFHRYKEAYRFAKLACDMVDKHNFIANQPKIYHATGTVAFWTQPVGTAIDFMHATFRTASETGDLTFACYGMHQIVPGLLLRNDPLDVVWRDSQRALDFALEARYGDVADIIRSQQRFIATMQGRTATFSTFGDAQFDEATFEAQLTSDRMPLMICFYWILKLKARFLSGNYAEALAAAEKAKPLLLIATAQIELLDYFYYGALSAAASYENVPADEQARRRELLSAHGEQLREWADNYPPTFGDKHALVSAEIARLEGRDQDTERLYREAIRLARENGFIQNEGLANELTGRFYAGRGFEITAQGYLRNARYCYLRWGADGKVRQLDDLYPHLQEESSRSRSPTTTGTSIEHLDLTTVMRVSGAVSGEIVLEKLIDTLMRTALEHAGAQRGLLIVWHGGARRIEAEATTSRETITVRLRPTDISAAQLPESILHYVVRAQESIILDDGCAHNAFSDSEYLRENRVRSVLCLPLIKQTTLIGVLYLENNLAPRVFTPARSAVLKLLASQAAISLENAYLYTDLQQENSERQRAEEALRRSQAYLAEAQAVSNTGSFGWNTSSGEIYWSAQTYQIFDFDSTDAPNLARIIQQTHPEDRAFVARTLDHARHEKDFDLEHRLLMPDGSVKHLRLVAHALVDESGDVEFVGAVMDVTGRKLAEESKRVQEREREEMQRKLQQAAKMEAIGRLAGGIAHDFNNILGAILGYGELAQNNVGEGGAVRHQIDQVMQAGERGKGLVDRILAFSHSGIGERAPVHVQSVVEETLELLVASLPADVRLERQLDAANAAVLADATQLHQLVMNLCTNAVQAMAQGGLVTVALDSVSVGETHSLSHGSLRAGGYVRLAVSDTGSGIPPRVLERMFDPFFTTKHVGEGTGLGLALVHGIVSDFDGVINVETQVDAGSTFTIWLPAAGETPRFLSQPPNVLPRGHGETVMIVDDERVLVALAEETLAELGYEPVGFDSAVAALGAFRADPERFDLVLTDETMPNLTGIELAHEIRRLRPDVSIILMSGYSDPLLSERAQAAGIFDVGRKPLARRDLAEWVARALHPNH